MRAAAAAWEPYTGRASSAISNYLGPKPTPALHFRSRRWCDLAASQRGAPTWKLAHASCSRRAPMGGAPAEAAGQVLGEDWDQPDHGMPKAPFPFLE